MHGTLPCCVGITAPGSFMSDNQNELHPIRPYGDLGGWFYLDDRTFRLYRVYTWAATILGVVISAWLFTHPQVPRDTWPSFWAAILITAYGQYRIVRRGRKSWEKQEQPRGKKTRSYSIVRFCIAQIAGWFLIIFDVLSIWADITRNHEVHAYQFILAFLGIAVIWTSIKGVASRRMT